ncbi:hypothetical protein [Leptospira santarosai]|uniref:Uncharacterized protein n=1 Tax=Leptospira santarosai serovar Shermani str. LT 821 TaxID=758847 RepID=K8XTP3_9LEPT|nr:hypothetical protein [Leptospira santarosai]EKS06540.1 hypothetical protein LEP1GSC071_1195 [Leptospira santarosai str. JET]EKT84844.1 hypothetical protein LSS_20613 [Leptospira santarosai serovar Shermani str. LT 821]EPG83169.1 hypothetical protein LEP1GSC048_3261 [Leptospira santarosai serovar Shermani str. 1342KT]
MTYFETTWATAILESKDPIVELEKHLQFLAETPECAKLLHYLIGFVDDIALMTSRSPEDSRAMSNETEVPRFYSPQGEPVLRVRMFAGKRELLIGAPNPNAKSEFPSLKKVWKHAGRLEINTMKGSNPIILFGENDDDPWYENDPLAGEDDEVIDQFAEWGPAPICDASYGLHNGPFYVYDTSSGEQGYAGEPALKKVSRPSWDQDFRDFDQHGTNILAGNQLNLNFGVGGIFLRVLARELLGGHIKLDDLFVPYETFRAKIIETGPWYLVDRAGDRYVEIINNPNQEEDTLLFRRGSLSEVPKTFGDSRFADGDAGVARKEMKKLENEGYVCIT